MKLTLDEKEQEIRDEVREFLAGNVLRPEDLPRDLDARIAVLRKWQKDVYDAGLVGIAWPKEYGGRGGAASQQRVAYPGLAGARCPQTMGRSTGQRAWTSLRARWPPAQKQT